MSTLGWCHGPLRRPGARIPHRKRLAIFILSGLAYFSGVAPSSPSSPSSPQARDPSLPSPRQEGVGRVTASADPQAETWTIGNGQIQVTFRLTAAGDFVLEQLANPQTGRVLNSAAAADSSVTINGSTSPLGSRAAGWTLEGAVISDIGSGVQLAFTFRSSATSLAIVRSYACYPGSPTIEAWTAFRASGTASVTVSDPNVWQLTFPASTIHYAFGLRGDAAGLQVDNAFTLQSVTLDPGVGVTLSEQNRSTEQFLPVIAADTESDEFFGGLIWSGSWQMAVQSLGGQVRVTAGLPRMAITVDAAHPLESPHGFFGFTAGGRNDVSGALRAFVVQGLRQGRPFQPLVTYNTWFAYGTEIDEETMMDEMAAAAISGIELFVVDAGWYLGAGHGSDFDSGLGTWQVDPARFPNGLGALSSYAHSLGMRFGLWVEPERVDLATVNRPQLAQEAWLATDRGGYQSEKTAQICLASNAARQWVVDRLTRLLDEVQPDYLKWDNNLWVNCNRSGHGHGATDGNFAHVTALYDVLATLRARYPTMLIENCAQGGNRLDFGMLRYTDTAWMDDRSSPAVHVRHNLEGLMTFFPPAYLLSIVIDDGTEPLTDAPDLSLLLRSRMPGILGLTYRAADLSETDREGIAQEIALYKRLRDIVREASGALLTEQAAPTDGPAWDSLQEVSASSGEVIVFAFQNDEAVPTVTVRPRRLESDTVYVATTADGTPVGRATGADLMADGIEIDGSPASAAHVLLLQPTALVPLRQATGVLGCGGRSRAVAVRSSAASRRAAVPTRPLAGRLPKGFAMGCAERHVP